MPLQRAPTEPEFSDASRAEQRAQDETVTLRARANAEVAALLNALEANEDARVQENTAELHKRMK